MTPCHTAATLGDGDRFPWRVSRADAIAIVNRGGDYVVHAAAPCAVHRHHVFTACGRLLRGVNTHPADTLVSCRSCRARDPRHYAPA